MRHFPAAQGSLLEMDLSFAASLLFLTDSVDRIVMRKKAGLPGKSEGILGGIL
jgi:hypothetical protein